MRMSRFLAGLLVVWLLGFLAYPLHGLVHVLLVLAIIVVIVDRMGRSGP